MRLIVALLFAFGLNAHANEDAGSGAPYLKSVPADQCPVYTTFAKAIMMMRNDGMSEAEAVPEVMRMVTSCLQNKMCPLHEGLETKRVLGFVTEVYGIEIPAGKHINVDASAANIEWDCERRAAAAKQLEEHPPLKPDTAVPFSGRQIEG